MVGLDGHGVPTGGSTGQALVKKSASSYDTEWQKLNMATPESIAIVADGDTAPQNITAGQYVIWKGGLYTASTNIASGGTLSNANLTAVPSGGLNSLLSIKANLVKQTLPGGTTSDYMPYPALIAGGRNSIDPNAYVAFVDIVGAVQVIKSSTALTVTADSNGAKVTNNTTVAASFICIY